MIESNKNMNVEEIELVAKIAEHYKSILTLIGEDAEREGLKKTPTRAAKALLDIVRGYNQSAEQIIKQATFTHDSKNIIIVKDIEFYSVCEHHILPFYGKVSIGYIPDGKIIGLSKLARIVDVFAHRLQVQEKMTKEICDSVTKYLTSKGVIVICEAGHMCMKMRGVEKQLSTTTTIEYSGEFATNNDLVRQFMDMLRS